MYLAAPLPLRPSPHCSAQHTQHARRYLVVGLYVGFATVGVFAAWYLFPSLAGIPITADGHSTVTWAQLRSYQDCPKWSADEFAPATSYAVAGGGTVAWGDDACGYFDAGKVKPATLSLTVLVVIEMLNALNALSEDSSLLRMPPWCNPWLLVAMAVSVGLHIVILYVRHRLWLAACCTSRLLLSAAVQMFKNGAFV
jgi:P-type Ca2+ transporter type 2C